MRDLLGQSLPGPSLTPLRLPWGLCPQGAEPRAEQGSCWESALLLLELGLLSMEVKKLRGITGRRGQSWALLAAASARKRQGAQAGTQECLDTRKNFFFFCLVGGGALTQTAPRGAGVSSLEIF